MGSCAREKCSPCGSFQTSAVSHARTHVKKQGRRQWRPQSSPPSRCQARTRDRAVTAGALSHGTTAACGWPGAGAPPARLPARPPGQAGQDGAQARTAALEAGCSRDFASRCAHLYARVTHLRAGIVAHTNACIKDAFRKPVLRCVTRRHSLIGHLEYNSWRRPLRQGSLGQPTAAPRALRACILCFAARGSFKLSDLTSRLAKVVGAPEDELCGKSNRLSNRRVSILSGDVGATVAIAMHASP